VGRDEPGGRKKCEAPRVSQPLVDRLSPKMQAKLTLLVRNRAQSDTTGTGVDVLLEMSGSPVAIQEGFRALRAGGRASLLGIPTEWVPLDLVNEVIFKGVTVQGIYGRRMYETWAQMTALLTHGGLNLEALFGEQKPFEDFENAFRLLQGGFADKVLLTPHA